MSGGRIRAGGRWPTPSPGARAALLGVAGVLLVGVAVWAGAVGPWTGRAPTTRTPAELPTMTNLPTPPPVTLPTVDPPAASGGSWDPTILLYLLGAVLVVVLLLVAVSMLRNRGPAPERIRRAEPDVPPPPPTPAMPDPDRPFDAREAADYVIACWDELEHRAASMGLGRHREQTPTEFLDALLDGRSLDRRAATELLGLYQRARFDHVRLAPDTAVRARTATDMLTAALSDSWATP